MANWNKAHIETLIRDGKIRGARIPERSKNYSADKEIKIPGKKSKALIWLDWNLTYWCNQRSLTLYCATNGNELQFDENRKWRFDYAIPAIKIAVEYEGGIFMEHSGHNTAKHYTKDTEKYNRATVLGWKVIRVTAMNYTTVIQALNAMI